MWLTTYKADTVRLRNEWPRRVYSRLEEWWADMVLPGARPVGMTLRFAARLVGLALWCFGALGAMLCASALGLASEHGGRRAYRFVSRTWAKGMLRLFGTRIVVRGQIPASPYFLVGNHVAWMDFFIAHTILDAVCVTKADVTAFPLAAFILKGCDLITVNRRKEELLDTNAAIVKAMEAGKNIVFAPEGTVSPGRRVCHFHSALLEPAVRLRRPVHYVAITVRTPDGWPPPSKVILTVDSDFFVRNPSEEESRLAKQARQKGLVRYLFGFLGLPWHEYVITFADTPVSGSDRKALAKALEQAIQTIFLPVQ